MKLFQKTVLQLPPQKESNPIQISKNYAETDIIEKLGGKRDTVDVIFESKEEGKLTDIPLRKNLVHSQTPQSFKINKFLEIYQDLSEEEIAKLDEARMLFF